MNGLMDKWMDGWMDDYILVSFEHIYKPLPKFQFYLQLTLRWEFD